MQKRLIPLVLLGILGTTTAAQAQLRFGSATVYKAPTNEVFAAGTPGASLDVIFASGTPTSKAATANTCGLAKIKLSDPPPNTLSINSGGEILLSNLPYNSIPLCTGGVLSEPRSSTFRTTNNEVVVVTAAGASATVSFTASSKRSLKYNDCGFVKVPVPSGQTYSSGTAFTIAGTSFTFGGLPEATGGPPQCRSVSGAYVPYRPATAGW